MSQPFDDTAEDMAEGGRGIDQAASIPDDAGTSDLMATTVAESMSMAYARLDELSGDSHTTVIGDLLDI